MKVLVTGGAGFIGSHVVEKLIENEAQVTVLDNLSTGSIRNLRPGAVFVKKDIRDRDLAEWFIRERFDYVIHQAAQTMVPSSLKDPYYDCDVNILGMVNVLEACRLSGVKRIIFASSAAVYGDAQARPLVECCEKRPASFYGESKLTGERYLELYRRNYGLEYVALRYANVYGERQEESGEGGVICRFLTRLRAGDPVVVYGDGGQTRDYIYVKDVAEANCAALLAPAANQSFNVSTAREISVNELIAVMANLLGCEPAVINTEAREGDIRQSVLDNTAAIRGLNWRPRYTLAEGLRLTSRIWEAKRLQA